MLNSKFSMGNCETCGKSGGRVNGLCRSCTTTQKGSKGKASRVLKETGKVLILVLGFGLGIKAISYWATPAVEKGILVLPNFSEGVFLCGEGSGTGEVQETPEGLFQDYKEPRGLLVVNKGHKWDREVPQLLHRASYLCPEPASWWRGFMGIGDHFHFVSRQGEWVGSETAEEVEGNWFVVEKLHPPTTDFQAHQESCNKDFQVIQTWMK